MRRARYRGSYRREDDVEDTERDVTSSGEDEGGFSSLADEAVAVRTKLSGLY
jgi:hypothetical protein